MKRSLSALAAPVLALTLLAGCAHSIHEVHVSDFRPYKSASQGRFVTARGEQFVILGITDNTRYVDDAYHRLIANCLGGEISGITTQYSTSLGFFSWTNKILMQGLCTSPRG